MGDGTVSVEYYREERDRWTERNDELERLYTEECARRCALEVEMKELKGLHKTLLNNYGSAKAKYERASSARGEALQAKREAQAAYDMIMSAIEEVGGSFDGRKVELPIDEELRCQLSSMRAELRKAESELSALREWKRKVLGELRTLLDGE